MKMLKYTIVLCVCLKLSQCASDLVFPEWFQFGVATSAIQIEGAWNTSDKGPNIWDDYVHKHPDFVEDRSNADIACDSYNNLYRDVEMVKELGVKIYRLSFNWPRILPKGTVNYVSKDGLKYYNRLINELLRNDIVPYVTLFHWDLPQVFMDIGGWANPHVVDYFEDYARLIFREFGDRVKNWITLNEPHQHCSEGYGHRNFVPALGSAGTGEYLCAHYQLLAHARVYHLYNNEFRPTQLGTIGITLDQFWAEAKNETSIEDLEAAERYLQMTLGMYAHPIYSEKGDYPPLVRERIDTLSKHQGFARSRLPRFTPQEVEYIRGTSDFFGLNHYTSWKATFGTYSEEWDVPSLDHDTGVILVPEPSWGTSGSWWLNVYPEGFRKLLNWITNEYGTKIPIVVTENGVSDLNEDGLKDVKRVFYYNNYLENLLLAIEEDKCNIIAYIAWTLMDDYEWNVGYTQRFGLYHVDFEDPKRTRTAKLSAFNYANIVKTRTINHDIGQTWTKFLQHKIKKENAVFTNRV